MRDLVGQARDADLVLFPELFTVELFTGLRGLEGDTSLRTHADRRASQSEYRSLFQERRRSDRSTSSAGPHLMRLDGRYVNVGHLFDPDGAFQIHVKTHIFPAESEWQTEEGDALEVFDLPFARVGFNICYEAEIPEAASTLAEQGAEIILCPSFTFTEFGFWRVRHCAQARCVENQVYFVHCCTGGQPGARFRTDGRGAPCSRRVTRCGHRRDRCPSRHERGDGRTGGGRYRQAL